MARKPRVHFKGALYHVICRGNNKENIFSTDYDKQNYIHVISRYKKIHKFLLYSYCIMDNHAHLVIEVNEVPLSRIMQGIQQVYTFHFNNKYDRVGHVFQQRYKAKLVDKQEYLLQLINYVHNNPVKANLEEGLDYLWSSHKVYLERNESYLVDKTFPLSLFSNNKNNQVQQYLNFMQVDDSSYDNKKDHELAPTYCLKGDDKSDVLIKKEDNIASITTNVFEETGIVLDDIRSKSRKKDILYARKLLVFLLFKHTNLNRKAIAEFVNLSQPRVTTILASFESMKA